MSEQPATSAGLGLEPFDPKKHSAVNLPNGKKMTEFTATAKAPDGRWMNVPQIWFTLEGKALSVMGDQAVELAVEYESMTGQHFPRFKNKGQAEEAAMHRSARGGASRGTLAMQPWEQAH